MKLGTTLNEIMENWEDLAKKEKRVKHEIVAVGSSIGLIVIRQNELCEIDALTCRPLEHKEKVQFREELKNGWVDITLMRKNSMLRSRHEPTWTRLETLHRANGIPMKI